MKYVTLPIPPYLVGALMESAETLQWFDDCLEQGLIYCGKAGSRVLFIRIQDFVDKVKEQL